MFEAGIVGILKLKILGTVMLRYVRACCFEGKSTIFKGKDTKVAFLRK